MRNVLALAVLGLVGGSHALSGQDPAGGSLELQNALAMVSLGQPLRLSVVGDRRFEGILAAVDGSTLFLAEEPQPIGLPVSSIERVWIRGSGARRGAWVGGSIGMLGGLLLGNTAAQLNCDCTNLPAGERVTSALMYGVGLGAVGALAGGLIGRSFPTWRSIFP